MGEYIAAVAIQTEEAELRGEAQRLQTKLLEDTSNQAVLAQYLTAVRRWGRAAQNKDAEKWADERLSALEHGERLQVG